jgi:hypothetical protein
MTEAEIKSVVDKLAEVAAVLHDADPDDIASPGHAVTNSDQNAGQPYVPPRPPILHGRR